MARDSKKTGTRWRPALGILTLAIITASAATAAFKLREYVITDPQFALSYDRKDAITIEGRKYASRSKVQRVFAGDFGKSVFSIPLAERRRRLLAINWVEEAAVLRIWPDRLVVRIRERKPVAFVFFRSGVLLIDAHGVLLDVPQLARFPFPVLSGVREDETEPQRQERVRVLLRVQEDMGYLAKDISELNAADPDNVRIIARVDHRALELILGDGNFARRYQNFLSHYPEIFRHSPAVRTFDLRLDDRITAKE